MKYTPHLEVMLIELNLSIPSFRMIYFIIKYIFSNKKILNALICVCIKGGVKKTINHMPESTSSLLFDCYSELKSQNVLFKKVQRKEKRKRKTLNILNQKLDNIGPMNNTQ